MFLQNQNKKIILKNNSSKLIFFFFGHVIEKQYSIFKNRK